MSPYITKDNKIKARWFKVNDPISSIAGGQMKVGSTEIVVSGIVKHVRGDDPIKPTVVRLYVEPDGGGDEIEVNPDHVYEVTDSGSVYTKKNVGSN